MIALQEFSMTRKSHTKKYFHLKFDTRQRDKVIEFQHFDFPFL